MRHFLLLSVPGDLLVNLGDGSAKIVYSVAHPRSMYKYQAVPTHFLARPVS